MDEGALFDVERGLLIDYRQAGNGRFDPLRCVVDPLVALAEGDPTCLLGCSLVLAGPLRARTPSYFLLLRQEPLSHVASP